MLIAVYGQIGAGKSTVMKIFNELGAATFSADEINREMLSDEKYLSGLNKIFPFAFEDGKLNKAALRKAVFSDPEALKKLNEYAHPEIFKRLKEKCAGAGAAFCEIPLLNASGARKYFDKTVYVSAKRETKLKRVVERDGIGEKEAERILAIQSGEALSEAYADYIIVNDGDVDSLREKVYKVYSELVADYDGQGDTSLRSE